MVQLVNISYADIPPYDPLSSTVYVTLDNCMDYAHSMFTERTMMGIIILLLLAYILLLTIKRKKAPSGA